MNEFTTKCKRKNGALSVFFALPTTTATATAATTMTIEKKTLRSQLIGHKTLVISSSLELRNCFFPYNWCYCCCFDYLTIAVVEWWQHRFCVHENMHLLFWRVPRWKINEKKQMAAHTTTIFKGRTTFFPPRSNIAPSIDRKLGFIFSLSKGAY